MSEEKGQYNWRQTLAVPASEVLSPAVVAARARAAVAFDRCPFCGSLDVKGKKDGSVWCGGCFAAVFFPVVSQEEARASWNQRAKEDAS